ncbi:hypothetical protein GUJ93_ZPchr0012g20727 [Zizania palustris]|uniref:Uncharacterized protein n=1 Tax=Zizania palustris TaxID=103762 RepID=A0A8J5WUT4_ZIZPA|nr:hypothetical protein GUJ93_ZPchr0012g20727 [Zizania palustris]
MVPPPLPDFNQAEAAPRKRKAIAEPPKKAGKTPTKKKVAKIPPQLTPASSTSSLDVRSSASEDSGNEGSSAQLAKTFENYLLEGDEDVAGVPTEAPAREAAEVDTAHTPVPVVLSLEPEAVAPNSPVAGVITAEVEVPAANTPERTSGDDLDEILQMYEVLGDPTILPHGASEENELYKANEQVTLQASMLSDALSTLKELGTENNPYLGYVYMSFQERATAISHSNTARLTRAHGDDVMAHTCGTIAVDERSDPTSCP